MYLHLLLYSEGYDETFMAGNQTEQYPMATCNTGMAKGLRSRDMAEEAL